MTVWKCVSTYMVNGSKCNKCREQVVALCFVLKMVEAHKQVGSELGTSLLRRGQYVHATRRHQQYRL